MSKPSSVPTWATSATGGDITSASSGKRAIGWVDGETPPHNYFNFEQNLIGQWCQWLKDYESTAHTWAALQQFTTSGTSALVATSSSSNLGDAGLVVTGTSGALGVRVVSGGISVEAGAITAVAGGVSGTFIGADGDVRVDLENDNTGTFSNKLRFGSGSTGEGISSNRAGGSTNAPGNTNGLDFWTNGAKRIQIYNNGQVIIPNLLNDPTITVPALADGAFISGSPKLSWWVDANGATHIEGVITKTGAASVTPWASGTLPFVNCPDTLRKFVCYGQTVSNPNGAVLVQVHSDGTIEANNMDGSNLNGRIDFDCVFHPKVLQAP